MSYFEIVKFGPNYFFFTFDESLSGGQTEIYRGITTEEVGQLLGGN